MVQFARSIGSRVCRKLPNVCALKQMKVKNNLRNMTTCIMTQLPADRNGTSSCYFNKEGAYSITAKNYRVRADSVPLYGRIIAKRKIFTAKDILKRPKRIIRPDKSIISRGLIDLSLFVEDIFGVRLTIPNLTPIYLMLFNNLQF